MARHGYAVVIQDVRGRFASDGEFDAYTHETEDGYDSVQWVAEQPWCDGHVGMCGVSYLAQAQLMAASARPPGLRAIMPMESPSGSTGGDRHRGGALALGATSYWATPLVPAELLRRARGRPGQRAQ